MSRAVMAGSKCPYSGRPQPSNMRSANQHPLCLGCAVRLVLKEQTWWHP